MVAMAMPKYLFFYLVIPPALLQDAMDHEYFNDLSETIRHT